RGAGRAVAFSGGAAGITDVPAGASSPPPWPVVTQSLIAVVPPSRTLPGAARSAFRYAVAGARQAAGVVVDESLDPHPPSAVRALTRMRDESQRDLNRSTREAGVTYATRQRGVGSRGRLSVPQRTTDFEG